MEIVLQNLRHLLWLLAKTMSAKDTSCQMETPPRKNDVPARGTCLLQRSKGFSGRT